VFPHEESTSRIARAEPILAIVVIAESFVQIV